jgi:hypothetical protein
MLSGTRGVESDIIGVTEPRACSEGLSREDREILEESVYVDRLVRHRKEETLPDVHLFDLEALNLLGVFDARSENLDPERTRELDEATYLFGHFVVADARDKVLIQFHHVDGETLEVLKR